MSKGLDSSRIDAAGVVVVLSALAIAGWFGLFKTNSATAELHDVLDRQVDLQTQHSRLQKLIGKYATDWEQLKIEAESRGNLDTQEPPELRLRAIRRMAERHGWINLGIMPVQWRHVTDVAEQTFSITAEAPYTDILAFLKEFEESRLWADISHFTVKPIARRSIDDPKLCKLEITLNFYSSFDADDKSL